MHNCKNSHALVCSFQLKEFPIILPTAYKGVFVSMSPRNAPCAASAITIGGAPYALNVRNCSAGIRIGESCIDNIQYIRFDSFGYRYCKNYR